MPGHTQAVHRTGGPSATRPATGSRTLPTTYPAFPIPSQDSVTRFLALAVAMHGFPSGVDDVLDDAFKGQPKKRKTYLDMTVGMLNA